MDTQAEKIQCLIVDDDLATRLLLEQLIKKESQLEMRGSVESGEEALEIIKRDTSIQVLFLDVQMPGMSGIDLIKALPEDVDIKTILITSSSDFAVDAFQLNAIDYVVKPVDPARFTSAVDRAVKVIETERKAGNKRSREIFFKSGSKFVRLSTEEIAYVEALSDYVVLVTDAGYKHVIHSTMKAMEDKLAPLGFMRIHRSFIVAMGKVESVHDHQVKVGKKQLPISKSYQDDFYAMIKQQN